MSVGEPRPAARCRGVFPAKVRLLTSAPSYGERHEAVRMGPPALLPQPCSGEAAPYLLHQVCGHVKVLHLHGQVQRGPPALHLRGVHVRPLPDQQVQAGRALRLHGQVHGQEAWGRARGSAPRQPRRARPHPGPTSPSPAHRRSWAGAAGRGQPHPGGPAASSPSLRRPCGAPGAAGSCRSGPARWGQHGLAAGAAPPGAAW